MIDVQILGASFFSTHHATVDDVAADHRRAVTVPAFPLLVARARRFTSLATQMHLEVCGALPIDNAEPPLTVFATCHGEIQTAETLIADFRANAMVSSARFALSVHNSPSGLYSVATGSQAASTTITGGNAIAAGWLEAALITLDTGRTVLLSIADEQVPAVFQGPEQTAGVAAAFLVGPARRGEPGALHLGPARHGGRRAQLAIRPGTASADFDAVSLLARAVHAATGEEAATLVLGHIQPGGTLELRFA